MTKHEIQDTIASAFKELANRNEMIYDFWLSVLHNEDGAIIENEWNEDNACAMVRDVAQQMMIS